MEVISTQKFILLTLAMVVFLTSNSMCLDELMKSSLQSREDDDDKYYKIKDSILEEKQRSLNFEEMKDWGSKNIIKMNTPTVNKVPNSVANLPLRFGRNYPEERSIKPIANLPLRFGRAFGENLPRHAPNLSQRLGRSPLVRSSIQSLLNLPQRFGKSLPVSLSQGVQESEPGNNKQRDLDKLEKWLGRNLMQFNMEKCRVLHLGMKNLKHQYMLGVHLERSFADEELGVLVDTVLNMRQRCAIVTKNVDCILDCMRKIVDSTSSLL
ncbi:pro-FMRFamide-related neuropeptide VF [Cygnus atratus]|uniref:pro-FMRFamide-related neuropeptide VF n=1 Tax=Cygnus atratus TaxID=8868 RepID=UPI0021B75316|nr:pro-FMRFamide-related neuropeptide VF [Cygnus atratus]